MYFKKEISVTYMNPDVTYKIIMINYCGTLYRETTKWYMVIYDKYINNILIHRSSRNYLSCEEMIEISKELHRHIILYIYVMYTNGIHGITFNDYKVRDITYNFSSIWNPTVNHMLLSVEYFHHLIYIKIAILEELGILKVNIGKSWF